MNSHLSLFYKKEVVPLLLKEFSYANALQVPRILKVVLSVSNSEFLVNQKVLQQSLEELSLIAGQRPVVTKAKKSISNFKLRMGQSVGLMVTLRGNRMYEFLNRLICLALPRVRDFKGLSKKSFDKSGNYNLGVKEQIIFPEIDYDKVLKICGLNISISTSARTDSEAYFLLKTMGFPFRN